jgi:hypothetical protein
LANATYIGNQFTKDLPGKTLKNKSFSEAIQDLLKKYEKKGKK